MMSYNIQKQTGNAQAFSNYIFVPTDVPEGLYLVNGRYVYLAKQMEGIDAVLTSDMQRRSLVVTLQDQVNLEPWNGEVSGCDMVLRFSKMRAGDEAVNENELLAHLKEVYQGHVFGENQGFIVQFGGWMFNVLNMTGPMFVQMTDASKIEVVPVGFKLSGQASRLRSDWNFQELGIGGLDDEFAEIYRRVFASWCLPNEVVQQYGIARTKGLLLHGPPGTGKTLIARAIGQGLGIENVTVVNGPEIFDKYVGGSEEKVRELFAPAENGDPDELHLIILDELDAICRKRGSSHGEVRDSVVNQLLSKMDGVNTPGNLLLIGMTNNLGLLDPALLRPGRFEVQLRIPLPNAVGRKQILEIHLKENQRLGELDLDMLVARTNNFTGAELAGLVRSACSHALSRCPVDGFEVTAESLVGMNDFEMALGEVVPAHGCDESVDLSGFRVMDYVEGVQAVFHGLMGRPLVLLMLHGNRKSGKTSLARYLAAGTGYAFQRRISGLECAGMSDDEVSRVILDAFNDSRNAPQSVIILDDVERLIRMVPLGPVYSNKVLQTILALTGDGPCNGNPKGANDGNELVVIMCTSQLDIMTALGLVDNCDAVEVCGFS